MERCVKKGYYLAGFFSYEAGYSFEEVLVENKKYSFPLLMIGAYKTPSPLAKNKTPYSDFKIKNLKINISKESYDKNIYAIKDHISKGNVYQITYCIKLLFDFYGNTCSLYNTLYKIQPVPYPAHIKTKNFEIISLSPERFVKKTGGFILAEPMKGTWPRGENIFSDFFSRYKFSKDKKNKAENIMITDLLRNDLGRVGLNIRAPKLYTITGYNTLFQMTSTVTGNIKRDVPLYSLFKSLFPSGSVTGAPKIRAMQIIRDVERCERKIYTGAIGYITPEKDMYFNIPIRTILLEGNKAEMGIGGGIVWDSTPDGEWDEGMLKGKFIASLAT